MPSINWLDVFFAWLAMVVHLLWCVRIDPSLSRKWLWSSLRAVIQLTLLGYLLGFLFEKEYWLWTGLAVTAMMMVSAWTVVSRTGFRYPKLFTDCLFSLMASTALVLLPMYFLFHDKDLLGKTSSFIPMVGLLLGNSLSGLSLGVAQWLRELRQRQPEIEFWLSIGATRDEAVSQLKTAAVKTAMTGVLNSMAVSGIVSIPGMMTGQLVAGGDPQDAVKYQIVVLFLIAAVVFGSCAIALRLSLYRLFDEWGIFRNEKMVEAK